jgi:NTP pyrophosphatase (non-canonical NTP hydrolase)
MAALPDSITIPINLVNEYQQEALKTKSDQFHFTPLPQHCDLLHAAIGISTEGGELLDALKKAIFYGKPLDSINLKEEVGDLMWYIALACHALGTTIDEVCIMNLNKLRARYPERFTSDAALVRDLARERDAMEGSEVNQC